MRLRTWWVVFLGLIGWACTPWHPSGWHASIWLLGVIAWVIIGFALTLSRAFRRAASISGRH